MGRGQNLEGCGEGKLHRGCGEGKICRGVVRAKFIGGVMRAKFVGGVVRAKFVGGMEPGGIALVIQIGSKDYIILYLDTSTCCHNNTRIIVFITWTRYF